MIALPDEYLNNMKKLLGDSFEEFLSSYDAPPVKGLRFNMKKARKDTVERLIRQWKLEPVPWCPTGFTFTECRPGLSPYHDAGVFYMQEPSAMCVAEEAEIGGSECVLDLCAAPGGKASAAAERCRLLLANEIHPGRARILSSNMERMGFGNTIVCSASPDRLSEILPGQFDTVICDAPCSGEGMMRKDETAAEEWSPGNVALCVRRQKMILSEAAVLVKPGGKLVYSTCTFEEAENEEQINGFLEEHPEFRLIRQRRIWPHTEKGEGHYCALLRKGCSCPTENTEGDPGELLRCLEKKLAASGIHLLRAGIERGNEFTDKRGKKIYEPSHAEIMATAYDLCSCGVNLFSEQEALRFLHGEVLRLDGQGESSEMKGEEGFCGVYYDGYPLGVGKRAGNTVKNHLPKGLRRLN